jgi:hypothetical protein
MIDDTPDIVHSGKSQRVIVDGYPSSIEFYRLASDTTGTIEAVDDDGKKPRLG